MSFRIPWTMAIRNWLQIYLNIKGKQGEWQIIDSCLMTWDVKEIIQWFRNLADNIKSDWKNKEFLEPNISFYLLNNFDDQIKQIKIQFDLEQFRKKFKPEPANDDI